MKHPLVSILLPNFNKALFLQETIASLQAQTYPHFEAIFVDDGSTDGSVEVLRAAVKADARFCLFEHAVSQGGSAARNLAFSHAKGEFVLFLDTDDVLTPSCLEQRVAHFLSAGEGVDFCVFPSGCFYQRVGDRTLPQMWALKARASDVLRFLTFNTSWSTMQPLWRRDFLLRLVAAGNVGPFDAAFPRLQDVEMHTRALLLEPVYRVFDAVEADCYYRIDEARHGLPSVSLMEYKLQGFLLFIERMGARIAQRPYVYRASLRMAFFEALVMLYHWSSQGCVSKAFAKQWRVSLTEAAEAAGLLRGYHRCLLFCYHHFFRGRVKGMNWLTRKLLAFL